MLFFKSKSKPPLDEPFFTWLPAEHSVGILRFDQDHKRLTTLLNQIHKALIQHRDRDQAATLMDQLLQEIRSHFFQEEETLKKAADLIRQFKAGTISGTAFPTFLKNWLVSHMKDTDRKYAACLRRHGER